MSLLHLLESDDENAQRRIKARYARSSAEANGWRKPPYNSMMYRESVRLGWITPEEAEADRTRAQARAQRTGQMKRHGMMVSLGQRIPAMPPLRWTNEPPIPSNQYAPAMATTAARDARLTPQAKALLVVLHARCGAARQTDTTKGTLGSIMSRCTRSVQRYIAELVRFGYITAVTRTGRKNMHVGLRIHIRERAQPFFDNLAACSTWLARKLGQGDEIPSNFGGLVGETALSPKNQSNLYNRKESGFSPPLIT